MFMVMIIQFNLESSTKKNEGVLCTDGSRLGEERRMMGEGAECESAREG